MANTHSLDLESSSSQYASITDASQTGLDITGDLTIEAWIKFESLPITNTASEIVAKMQGTGVGSYKFSFFNSGGVGQVLALYIDDGTIEVKFTTFEPSLDRWYHVASTFNASTSDIKFYVDGSLIDTVTGTSTSIQNSTEPLRIGAATNNSNYFDGLIDEVRVWNDVRTESEIQDNLGVELVGNEANLQGYWKLNNDYTDETSNGNDLTASGSPVFSTDVPFENPAGVSDSTRLTTNLQGYWTLDEESGTRADSTANGNDLTDNNTVGFGTGKQDNAADFETATDEYLSITDASQTGLDITGDLSISMWINFESIQAVNGLISKFDSGQKSYQLDTDGTPNIRWNISSDGSSDEIISVDASSVITSTATWYHLVTTFDASASKFSVYVDGILVGSNTGTRTSLYNSTTPFLLAGRNGGATVYNFDGLIDETGIWDKVLTFGEIQDLYAQGAAIPYAAAATDTGNALSMSNF